MKKSGGFKKGKSKKRPPRDQKKGPAEAKPAKDYGKDFRGIVRLAGKDIRGELPIQRALLQVRGVGERLSAVLGDVATEQLKLSDDTVIGLLTEEQMNRLEEILSNPAKYGVPGYLLNRQKDSETGTDRHLIGTDVRFIMRQDVEKEKNLNTWKGYRHLYGQKVRGQHTRTTGRTGMTVGVLRKTVTAAVAAAKADEAEKPGRGAKPAKGAAEAPAESKEKGGAGTAGSGAEKKGEKPKEEKK
ncbi:30S ribosomal protein S13 [Candidatus Micrarchaeota archaeon]|nr:MAG: 30S ribosomal protein S13 [Candidatus Micrarchaeota archaeon]